MKINKKIALCILFAILGTGCTSTTPKVPDKPSTQKSVFVVMKTPVFRYADQGFIQKEAGSTKLEIYSSGSAIMKLYIKSGKVCNGTGLFSCMSKSEFNKRFLSSNYGDNLFENVLNGKTIFHKEGLNKKANNGFKQKISKDGKYNIEYSVLNDKILFRDRVSNILIKVNKIDE